LTRVRTRWQQGPVSVAIVALTVGVWLVHEVLITWFGVNTDLSLQDNGSAIHGQPWRLVTPLVVHYQIGGMPSIVHLGLNMWALWIIGPPVEKVIGRRLYAASYLIAGAAGQVASDLYYQWHPLHQNGQVVQLVSGGASGAVFGVVGLLVGDYAVTAWAERHGRASSQEWRFNPSAVRSLAIQGTAWIVLTSVLVPGIDNWAHIGGAATGLLIGGGVAWSRTAPATTPSG
jgi:rhomboid protease GluP